VDDEAGNEDVLSKLIRRISACAVCLLASLHAVQAELSELERKIVRHVDEHTEEAIALLQKVVDIESPTEDVAGVRAVGEVFRAELEALGLSTRWIDLPPEMERAGHLVARTKGTRGKRVLLLGHLDTVLRGERFRREGTKAYGTGTSDMKGGDVLLLYALKALDAVGALDDARIQVVLTGEEESPGRPFEASRAPLVAAAEESDAALSFESTIRNTATVGRRGSSSWTLEVTARTGHSSQIFKEAMGVGSVFEASRILHEFYSELGAERYLTFNPSVIVGGTEAELGDVAGSASGKTNVVAARTLVRGDLRFISEAQKESARTRMREICARSLPGTTASVTFRDGFPAMTPNEGNHALLALVDRVSQDLGTGRVEPLDPGERGAGDIAFVSHVVASLDGIGAGEGGNEHAPGEWVDLESFPLLTRRAALLIYRLTR
jgi:glutamate carboxypeptidase